VRAMREVGIPGEKAAGHARARYGNEGRPSGGLDELVPPGTRSVSHIREIHGQSS
jgi:hypothetical protein